MPRLARPTTARLLLAAALIVLPAAASLAQDAQATQSPAPQPESRRETSLAGDKLTDEALKALPSVTLDIAFQTSKGEERAAYTGVPLWNLLEANGLIDTARHHGELRQAIRISASDGYYVVFSGGEIAPAFGAKQVLLAYARDGQPLAPGKGPRLVVPGDTRGARAVVGVTRIDVVEVAPAR